MKNAHIALLCFDTTRRSTLNEIKHAVLPYLLYHNSFIPYILVGTKRKYRANYISRQDNNSELVSTSEAHAVAKELHCVTYIETSYDNDSRDPKFDNIMECFEIAARIASATAHMSNVLINSSDKKKCLVQ